MPPAPKAETAPDPVPNTTAEALAEAEQRGYNRGFADGRETKRPPLFEAAKTVCEQHYDAPTEVVQAKLADLEATYGETLSRPDRGLLDGIVRRYQMAAEAQRQAFVQTPRPKSKVGETVAKRLSDSERAVPTFETVT